LELGSQLRMSSSVGRKALIPLGFAGSAGGFGIPLGIDVDGNLERAMIPAKLGTGRGNFIVAQRRTVALFLAPLVRRAKADHRLAADQRRTLAFRAGGLQRGLDLLGVVAVDIADHLPAVGFETRRG